MAEITIGRTLAAATDSVTVEQGAGSAPWVTSSPLVPELYDSIDLGYTGDDLTTVTYKLGVATVATLTLGYTGGRLTSVVRT